MKHNLFLQRHPWDHWFYPLLLAPAWLAIVMGFGPKLVATLAGQVPVAPLYLHVHAFIFGGWMLLLSAQTLLVQRGRLDLHRKLGLLSAVLVPLVVGSGLLTAIWMNQHHYDTGALTRPAFISIQWGGMLVFAVAAGLALAWRSRPHIHKRLIWLATIELLGAGFGRWLGRGLRPYFGDSGLEFWFTVFLGTNLMLLVCVVYDLASRRRVHPVWLYGIPLQIGMQAVAVWLFKSPFWLPIALKLIDR
jgi:hypothetical protein